MLENGAVLSFVNIPAPYLMTAWGFLCKTAKGLLHLKTEMPVLTHYPKLPKVSPFS